MNSSLSPTLMLFDNTDYTDDLIEHARNTATKIRNGETEYDFLAFDVCKTPEHVLQRPLRHPDVVRIKKTLQRDAQRKKLKAASIPYIRSQRSMCFLRARAWLELFNYPFFHLPDGSLLRREIGIDGKERIGARGVRVGSARKSLVKVKDPIRYAPHIPEQPELECMEQWRMGLPKPPSGDPKEPTPVAFEHHAVHGKQPLLRKRGNPHATLQRVTNKQK
jgi:hypothetical protein